MDEQTDILKLKVELQEITEIAKEALAEVRKRDEVINKLMSMTQDLIKQLKEITNITS